MHYRSIAYVLNFVMGIIGVFLLLPALVAVIYGEMSDALVFVAIAVACVLLSRASSTVVMRRKKKPSFAHFTIKDGYISVAMCWIVISLLGALPFTISGAIPSYLDAVFETVSGFTTTGASILADVEALGHGMLFWRSFTHWIGGMGILVFILIILPMTDSGSGFALMQAESPGPSVSKLVPRLRMAAGSLYGIYCGLTVMEVALLVAGKMPLFDSFCIAFGTMGTGGFGVLNSSIASYSPYLQWVIIIFMLLAATDFGFFFLLLRRQWGVAAEMEEVRWYYIIAAGATILICMNLAVSGVYQGARQVLFQVASIMTTTGFATTDFDQWPLFSKNILVVLMFIGGCAGSTGGGVKVSRVVIYFKSALHKVHQLTQPRHVRIVRLNGKKLEDGVYRGALLFLASYTMVFFVSLCITCLESIDYTTAFTAVASMLNNIGPGLELVGPTCNFSFFSPLTKIVFIFDMLAGRLGVFPVLILFSVNTWKR